MLELISILIQFLQLYQMILVVRIILTWFPAVRWYDQPWRFLAQITDPVMEPFRRLIPPIGGIDLSPILLFFAIGLLQKLLQILAQGFVTTSF